MEPRTWRKGDPEPLNVVAVVDIENDVWFNLEPNSWYEQHTGPDYACSWSTVLEFAPLREHCSHAKDGA